MKEKRLAKSIRKFIRKEKARIRRGVLSFEKQKELINELCKKYQRIKNEVKV